jgi:hypothetical protein
MAKKQFTTAETSVSKTKEEIIKEAKRIEEALLFSSKGHFAAAAFWSNFHLYIGIPMVLLSAIAGASALAQFDPNHLYAGVASIIVVALSGLLTYLNPNEKSAKHLTIGNDYDSLMNKIRIFWSIDCWSTESEQILTKRLKDFSEQKDKLNKECPQIPGWAYRTAKKGIVSGQGDYTADKK